MKYVVGLLLTILCAVPVDANNCRAVVRKQEVVVQKVVIEKVAAIAVPVVAVATVPYYASYYSPPQPIHQPQANAAGVADNGELTNAVKVLVEQMKLMNERLERLERGISQPSPMPPAPDPKPPKPVDPFNPQGAAPLQQHGAGFTSCIQCHQVGGTGTVGPQGIVLFDGQKRIIPGVEGKMMASVYAGRMPKGSPFDDPKTGSFMASMDEHLKQKGK